MGRVIPSHIKRRVRFGVAQLLGLFQDRFQRIPFGDHLGEDVVARPVDNASDRLDMVGAQALADRLDDRNAPGDTGFKRQGDIAAQGFQLITVVRQHRLVGRRYPFAMAQGVLHHLPGIFDPAHQLHDDIDIRVTGHIPVVVTQGDIDIPAFGDIPDHPFDHHQLFTGPGGDDLFVGLQDIDHAPAYRADSDNSDF